MLREILLSIHCWLFHRWHHECLGKQWYDTYDYRCEKCGRTWQKEIY